MRLELHYRNKCDINAIKSARNSATNFTRRHRRVAHKLSRGEDKQDRDRGAIAKNGHSARGDYDGGGGRNRLKPE
jgi:hypothetical protein